MKKFEYRVQDEVGMHARPAGMLVKEAKNYDSKIVIKANKKSAEATKLIALMGLGIKKGHNIEVEITGVDEEKAYEGIKSFFENNL